MKWHSKVTWGHRSWLSAMNNTFSINVHTIYVHRPIYIISICSSPGCCQIASILIPITFNTSLKGVIVGMLTVYLLLKTTIIFYQVVADHAVMTCIGVDRRTVGRNSPTAQSRLPGVVGVQMRGRVSIWNPVVQGVATVRLPVCWRWLFTAWHPAMRVFAVAS